MNKFIKPYAFIDFFEEHWAWKKLIKEGWGEGNISKTPTLFTHSGDWAFLSQFPKEDWPELSEWRHGAGLMDAAHIRNKKYSEIAGNDRKNYQALKEAYMAIPDEVDYLDIPSVNNTVTRYWHKDGKKIKTGLRELLRLSEAHQKLHPGHSVPHEHESPTGHIAMSQIDLKQQDPNHPSHRSHYEKAHGLHGRDFFTLVKKTPEEIAQMTRPPDLSDFQWRKEQKELLQGKIPGYQALSNGKNNIAAWVLGQSLGLLSQVGNQIQDPITGQLVNTKPGTLKDFADKGWHDTVNINAPLQFIDRQITKQKIKKTKGSETPIGEPQEMNFSVPVLNNGIALARLSEAPTINSEGKPIKISKDSPTNELWSKMKNSKIPEGALRNLSFWNEYSPEQKQWLMDNRLTLLDLATQKAGFNNSRHAGLPQLVGGYDSSKGQRGEVSMGSDSELNDKIIEKYYKLYYYGRKGHYDKENPEGIGGMEDSPIGWGADALVNKYLDDLESGERNFAATWAPAKDQVEFLRSLDLGTVAAAYLVMRANHPTVGVHDPELGLHKTPPLSDDPEEKEKQLKEKDRQAAGVVRDLVRTIGERDSSGASRRTANKARTQNALFDTNPETGGERIATIDSEKSATKERRTDDRQQGHKKAAGILNAAANAGMSKEWIEWVDKNLRIEAAKIAQFSPRLAQEAFANAFKRLKEVEIKGTGHQDYTDPEMDQADTTALRRQGWTPELMKNEDEAMETFFNDIINGETAQMPKYYPEKTTGNKFRKTIATPETHEELYYNLDRIIKRELGINPVATREAQLSNSQGLLDHITKKTAKFILTYWTREGAKKWTPTLVKKIYQKLNLPISSEQNIQNATNKALSNNSETQTNMPTPATTSTDMQTNEPATAPATPAPVDTAMPQKPTAMAATDLTGLLAQFPQNPALWKQLKQRENELLAPSIRPALDASIEAVRNAFRKKDFSNLTEDEQEAYALVFDLKRKEQQRQ